MHLGFKGLINGQLILKERMKKCMAWQYCLYYFCWWARLHQNKHKQPRQNPSRVLSTDIQRMLECLIYEWMCWSWYEHIPEQLSPCKTECHMKLHSYTKERLTKANICRQQIFFLLILYMNCLSLGLDLTPFYVRQAMKFQTTWILKFINRWLILPLPKCEGRTKEVCWESNTATVKAYI